MAVTSIRLNAKEEKVLNYLKKHYKCDSSTLLKRSLIDLYEDIKDREIIENFEKRAVSQKSSFITFDDIIK